MSNQLLSKSGVSLSHPQANHAAATTEIDPIVNPPTAT